jgi:hypothetical protein
MYFKKSLAFFGQKISCSYYIVFVVGTVVAVAVTLDLVV